MRIANLQILEEFIKGHAVAFKPLKNWKQKTEGANWKNPEDVRNTFAVVSFVKHLVIFNVGGNKFRLLAEIFYRLQQVRILKIGTHADYGRWKL